MFIAVECGMTAQTDAGLDLWIRVREHVRASAAQLPNYTCQESMERSIQAPTGRIEFRERLRLEVLFAEKTERFAWPGSSEFTSEPLQTWIGAGAIGNGDFATGLLNLFVISAATVKCAGIETRDQRALHRFDFHIPILNSGYTLTTHGKSASTAYSGSFCVEQESLDIARLDTRPEGIPSDLDIRDAHQSVTYGRVRLGADPRLLPSAAELTIVSGDGHESRNTIAFNNCRQYAASSSLSFTTPPDIAAAAGPRPQRALPSQHCARSAAGAADLGCRIRGGRPDCGATGQGGDCWQRAAAQGNSGSRPDSATGAASQLTAMDSGRPTILWGRSTRRAPHIQLTPRRTAGDP